MKRMLVAIACLVPALAGAQVPAGAIEATTGSGQKIWLLPGGRWEYADQKKAEPQRQERRAEDERERNAQGLFGGRRVYPGDKDYNRGTLNPNRR
jgi:hypothetical protein